MSTKIPILSVYNENGNRIGIPAIRGKSAYQYAVDGGYTGTEEEFAEKLAFLMGYSVFGYVDENNDVILSGNLADGTYTLKYEMADGTYSEIGNLVVGEIVAEPVNLFVIGGDGYIINGRCSSTGADRSDSNGYIVSNYIEVENGDTVYIKYSKDSSDSSGNDAVYFKIESITKDKVQITYKNNSYVASVGELFTRGSLDKQRAVVDLENKFAGRYRNNN